MSNLDSRIRAHDRQLQALELRKAGLTYERIAQHAGYRSRQAAHNAVRAALKYTLAEAAADVRALEVERLDALLVGVYPSAVKGNQGAIDRVLRIMERRARLLGLDAPIQQEIASRIDFVVDLSADDRTETHG